MQFDDDHDPYAVTQPNSVGFDALPAWVFGLGVAAAGWAICSLIALNDGDAGFFRFVTFYGAPGIAVIATLYVAVGRWWGGKPAYLFRSTAGVGGRRVGSREPLVYAKKPRRWLSGRSLGGDVVGFFGGDFGNARAHEKMFPGYDLASVHRGLISYFADDCLAWEELGNPGFAASAANLLDQLHTPAGRRNKGGPAASERLPVDVGRDESFPTNVLYLCQVRDPGGGPAARAAVLVRSQVMHVGDDSFSTDAPPGKVLQVGLITAAPGLADRFFADLDQRRRERSIFRGKVIDPRLAGGRVLSVGFRPIRRVGDDDLILDDGVRTLLEQSVVGFYRHQNQLRKLGVELKRGVLFHGPPGTGKTSICLWLADRLPEFTVCFASGEQLLHPRELCRMARYLQPAMLVFEDIDLIAAERDRNGLATVLGELMNQIDGCDPDERVLFVMNTNSLDRLEQAVRDRPGRVDQIVRVGLPDASQRRALLSHFARSADVEPGAVDLAAAETDGATPAMLKEVVKRAAVLAVERAADRGNDLIRLESADLRLAARQVLAMRGNLSVGAQLGRDVL